MAMKNAIDDQAWFENDLVARFVRYARIYTTSDDNSPSKPSTARQWDLLNLLEAELKALGLETAVDAKGYVIGKLPASPGVKGPAVAYLAHVDTSPDSPGDGVKPLIHRNYNGQPLALPAGPVLDPAECPTLLRYRGQTIITSDGSTLLGADDKAGIAEIMTALAFLQAHPDWKHGPLEVVFTSDEEVGRGTEGFPFDKLSARYAYTLDGSEEGSLEAECYNAWKTVAEFTGRSIHPGSARGLLVNAASMAAAFINLIPRSESPEATDGRFGCLWVSDMKGAVETASVDIRIRDFDDAQVKRRLAMLDSFALAVEAAFPGGKVKLTHSLQYLNMKPKLDEHPRLITHLEEAIRRTGLTPWSNSIRGGTDGARLTELGLPTPNIFTGGMNYHSRTEWVAVPAMANASRVILHLSQLWAGAEA